MEDLFSHNIVREDSIPVVYAANNNNAIYTLISMVSLMEHTSAKIDFVLLYSELSDDTIKTLDFILKYDNCNVIYVELNPQFFCDVTTPESETAIEWYRIIIPHVLTKIDKAVYLDNFTMLRGDISEFYNTDIKNNFVAGVTDVWSVDYNVKRLGITDKSYINTSVLLINCAEWRKNDLYENILDCAFDNIATFFRVSDVLNFACNKKKLLLSPKFNYIETWWHDYLVQYKNKDLRDYEKIKKNPLIVNFTVYKPDDEKSKHSFKDEWLNYFKNTPFYSKK